MAAIFRFFASLLAHVFWHRSGRQGPLPAIRLPGKRTPHLPVPSAWQIMLASWVLERLWKSYGPMVKRHLTENPSALAHKMGALLPGPEDTTSNPAAAPSAGAATQLLPQNQPGDPALPSGSLLRSLRPSR